MSTIWYYTVLIFESALGVFGLRLYEQPAYAVLDSPADNIEIRRYAPRLAAEVALDREGGADGRAFTLLFNYIAGANRNTSGQSERVAMTAPVDVARPEKIAMTAPVQTDRRDGAIRMRFFLPTQLTADTAPVPADDRVRIVKVPEETVATLRFTWTGRDLAERQQQLIAALENSRWQPTAAPYGLFYDAPFTIPFLRRNEAAVTVTPR
ncbi:SOUL family heme-binding protein [Rhodopseudomonas pseudopalustris]|uniref:SOUL heme-binding protein n=1 Tax=Rhodopseudomonas pseudopalustris TaxID=1513892 RepID=A0A1H8QIL2_9BRAD|nr:heme-binding protein [Rhodopseudomonas pseudopalustris]SEO53868.1 SOUL heme-binding protein [Rhodopseudomonas pseudopalustris]